MGKRTLKPAPAGETIDDVMREDELDEGDGLYHVEEEEDEDDGLDDDLEPHTAALSCVYCECTEDTPCMIPADSDEGSASVPCSWYSNEPNVCNAPDCIAALKAHEEDDDAIGTASDEPSITEVEAAAPLIAPMALGELRVIPIGEITPDPDQPRQDVDDELADSIKANGVQQPITVRVVQDQHDVDWFMIIDGERRYRGALKAGLAEIPARVVDDHDETGDRLLRQVTFNDGKRLAPMEEAKAWKRIMDSKGWTAQQLGLALGRAKSTVSDRLAMLDVPALFQKYFADGSLTASVAPIVRRLAQVPEPILVRMVEVAGLDRLARDFARRGKTIPLQHVEDSLKSSLGYPFPEVAGKYADEFKGETFEVAGKKYAADYNVYQKHLNAHAPKAKSSKSTSTSSFDWKKDQAAREAKRQQQLKLRRVQVAAISAKLPTDLSTTWLLLVVNDLLDNADLANVAEVLGIAPPAQKTASGSSMDKLVMARVNRMTVKELQRLPLQLLLADQIDAYHDDKQLKEFARLVKVDLKKVKLPVEPTPAAAKVQPRAAKPAKKSAKKSTSKKRR